MLKEFIEDESGVAVLEIVLVLVEKYFISYSL
jgi:hypothetical protein